VTSTTFSEDAVPHDLTARQRELLAALDRLHRTNGYPPSLRELGAATGLSSAASVHHHVKILEARGLVDRLPGAHRTLRPRPAPSS
jgi:repressor LexA